MGRSTQERNNTAIMTSHEKRNLTLYSKRSKTNHPERRIVYPLTQPRDSGARHTLNVLVTTSTILILAIIRLHSAATPPHVFRVQIKYKQKSISIFLLGRQNTCRGMIVPISSVPSTRFRITTSALGSSYLAFFVTLSVRLISLLVLLIRRSWARALLSSYSTLISQARNLIALLSSMAASFE